MFNEKRDTIRTLVWDVDYYKGRVVEARKFYEDKLADKAEDLLQARQDVVDRNAKLAVARKEAEGYVTTYEVTTTVYERDEDDLKVEASNDVQVFKDLGDALHYARNGRIYVELSDEPALVLVTTKKVETRRTPLDRNGKTFGTIGYSELYGSPFFATAPTVQV